MFLTSFDQPSGPERSTPPLRLGTFLWVRRSFRTILNQAALNAKLISHPGLALALGPHWDG